MQSVITMSEAKKITRGRTPLVPVEYETACKALVACQTLDEAKYWDNKADALAAWAKIYRNDEAGQKARALKLWAYRRMGQLAAELRPRKFIGSWGSPPGPKSLLLEQGLSSMQASAARRLALAAEETVKALAELPRPPAPNHNSLRRFGFTPNPQYASRSAWGSHPTWGRCWPTISDAAAETSKISAKELARSVDPRAVKDVRARTTRLTEWLDEFNQYLPRPCSGEPQ